MSSRQGESSSNDSASQRALAHLHNFPTPTTPSLSLSLYIHSLLLTHGFRPSNLPPSTNLPTELPSIWTPTTPGGVYRHTRSSLTFDIRMTTIGQRLVVHAVAVEDQERMHTLEVRIDDYVGDVVEGKEWWERLTQLEQLETIVRIQLVYRLVPEGAKQGYQEQAAQTGESAGGSSEGAERVRYVPVPMPVGGERDRLRDDYDPLRIGPPRRPMMPGIGGEFGRDDLFAPGLPRGPGFGGIGGGRMGGNLMGPRNFPGMGGMGGMGGRGGIGDGRPDGVPPGARFDPYGPMPDNDIETMPGFEDDHGLRGGGRGPMGRFGRGGGSSGRGGHNGRGGGDDEGPPPGMYF